ncbi:hypothetical protein JW851_00695 [Candidatus Woesearchaeota archaeon]|nr:hypothetical protein [Candidatus Woesearchaeota archaeon]
MEEKHKEDKWSGYFNVDMGSQRKYQTGSFRIVEESWRPTSTARLYENNHLNTEKKE